jgi:hypothetical protein
MNLKPGTPLLSDIVGTDEIYIVFGGQSLRGFNFSRLYGNFTLGCNRAAYDANCAAIISMDCTYINSNKYELRDFKKYTILASSETNQSPEFGMRIVDWIKPDYLYWLDKKNPDSMSLERGTLCGQNTGHAAINFAALEGFKKIHALGLDLKQPGWWHKGYGRSCGQAWMTSWAKALDDCKKHLDNMGVTMVNYNSDSAVRAYPFGDLRSI